MLVLKKMRKKIRLFNLLNLFLPLFLAAVLFNACGGNNGNGDSGNNDSEEKQAYEWRQSAIGSSLGSGGLLSPRVSAAIGSDGNIHIAYFDDSDTNVTDYEINYIVTDMNTFGGPAETVISVDNTSSLSLSLQPDNSPVVAYQGGVVRECNYEKRSDAMFSVRQSSWSWNEYTGAIGVVDRNPALPDGLAGKELSVVVDSAGYIHIAYQFFYEGCDEQNFTYPDIMYVRKDPAALDSQVTEEVVEGNTYGDISIQNSAGTYAVITLDGQGDPAIFYYATLSDGTTGLRVARKKNGVWEPEWIETDCEIGDISAANAGDGYLAVAYYVKSCTNKNDDTHLLRYAKEQSSSWAVQTVDDTVKAGNYCSLAFSSSGAPAIAYYALESYSGRDLKDLKLAQLNENSWNLEVVASTGDIGLYNTLLFDGDSPVIISYSGTDKTIYAFY